MSQNQSITMRGMHVAQQGGRTPRATQSVRADRDIKIARGARVAQDEAASRQARAARASQGGGSRHGDPGGNHPNRSGKGGKGIGKRVALVVLLIAALALAGLGLSKCSQPSTIEDVTGGWFYDQTSTEIQEAIDHEVEDGYFNMSVNTSVPVSEGTALVNIKNIEENKFDCIVTITLEDGTQVYQSGGLAPGSELKYVTLTQDLPAGDYEATALFEIYEQDEAHTKAGQTASKITLHVQ